MRSWRQALAAALLVAIASSERPLEDASTGSNDLADVNEDGASGSDANNDMEGFEDGVGESIAPSEADEVSPDPHDPAVIGELGHVDVPPSAHGSGAADDGSGAGQLLTQGSARLARGGGGSALLQDEQRLPHRAALRRSAPSSSKRRGGGRLAPLAPEQRSAPRRQMQRQGSQPSAPPVSMHARPRPAGLRELGVAEAPATRSPPAKKLASTSPILDEDTPLALGRVQTALSRFGSKISRSVRKASAFQHHLDNYSLGITSLQNKFDQMSNRNDKYMDSLDKRFKRQERRRMSPFKTFEDEVGANLTLPRSD